jgi:peptidyl-prolyl cis-trans isomerase C
MVAKQVPQLEVQARHILVAEEKKAHDIIKKLNGGAGFGELARRHSTGPSGPKGGDLGYFSRSQMVPPFAEAAFAMEPGNYSQTPVQTRFGWHIILVEDRRQKPPPSFAESAAELKAELSRGLVAERMAELRKGADISRAKSP